MAYTLEDSTGDLEFLNGASFDQIKKFILQQNSESFPVLHELINEGVTHNLLAMDAELVDLKKLAINKSTKQIIDWLIGACKDAKHYLVITH